jgi:uncharacterized protein
VSEPVAIAASDGMLLAGALTRVAAPGASPAALLLNGSGALDRDSNMPGQALNVANALAGALAAHGIASLRYDKRGVGESAGDYLSTGFHDETADALAALAVVRESAGVDPSRIAIIGHSVGATIAIRLAAARDWLAGIVLLGAASRPGSEVMRRQSDRIAASLRLSRLRAPRFLRGQERARRLLLSSTGDVAELDGVPYPARWFREYMTYDPAADLAAIRCPVLAITGRSDIQVDAGDIACIGRAVSAPFTGETPEALSHILRTQRGRPSLASYPAQLRRPVDADLLERIAGWVEHV